MYFLVFILGRKEPIKCSHEKWTVVQKQKTLLVVLNFPNLIFKIHDNMDKPLLILFISNPFRGSLTQNHYLNVLK